MSPNNQANSKVEIKEESELSKEIILKVKQLFKRNNNSVKEIKLSLSKIEKSMLDIKKNIDSHGKSIREVAETAEKAEETLLNVLLAIRQNEYLQAWYPAQHGFPSMKVSGTHPLNEVI